MSVTGHECDCGQLSVSVVASDENDSVISCISSYFGGTYDSLIRIFPPYIPISMQYFQPLYIVIHSYLLILFIHVLYFSLLGVIDGLYYI